MADNRCCRPCHPHVHTARACSEPLSTATTPRRARPSVRDAVGLAKRSAKFAATRAPNGSSGLLVCQCVVVLRHGGQPNRLFPKMGDYSQIRSGCVVCCTHVPYVIRVASTHRPVNWANGSSVRKSSRPNCAERPDDSLPLNERAFRVSHFVTWRRSENARSQDPAKKSANQELCCCANDLSRRLADSDAAKARRQQPDPRRS